MLIVESSFRHLFLSAESDDGAMTIDKILRADVANIFRSDRVIEREELVYRQRRAAQTDVAGQRISDVL